MLRQMVLGAMAALGLTAAVNAEVLLVVDLSVENEVTISATDGLSAATLSGSSFTGVLLGDFYSVAPGGFSGSVFLDSGDLTTAANPSDGSPSLFSDFASTGLNIWSFSTDTTVSFTAGAQAFSGSATWTLAAADYANMVAGNAFGDIYFPADSDDDIDGATLIGQWEVVIPTPGALALLGVAGLVGTRRRR